MKLKLCWDYAYDVPLISSLKTLLANNDILEEVFWFNKVKESGRTELYILQVLLGHKRSDGLIGDYCDGDVCNKDSAVAHPLFSTNPKALQILLFYDDLEVVNPLGSYTKKHKIGKSLQCTRVYITTYTFL